MDSARLYLELVDAGERLNVALADARSANVIDLEDLDYTTWQNRVGTAHLKVELAAECYAVALRTYRLAMLAELAPSDPTTARRSGAIVRRRRRARSMAAVCTNSRVPGNRKGRKDVSAERFPESSTLSKSNS